MTSTKIKNKYLFFIESVLKSCNEHFTIAIQPMNNQMPYNEQQQKSIQ